MVENYFPIIIVFLVAAGFAFVSLIATHLFGPRVPNAVKMMPYESGIDQVGDTRIRVSIRFFLIALLFIIFDIEIGADYPDGDEWFIADFLFPYDMKISDEIIGPDYFTTIPTTDNKKFWHHREMIRYKYGKTKKLSEALEFLEVKYKELHSMVEPLEKDIK